MDRKASDSYIGAALVGVTLCILVFLCNGSIAFAGIAIAKLALLTVWALAARRLWDTNVLFARLIAAIMFFPLLLLLFVAPALRQHQTVHQTSAAPTEKPRLKFWWEWKCDSPFWPANNEALTRFGYGPVSAPALGLPNDLGESLVAAGQWHDTSLNWDYPPDPGPWRQAECDRFNTRSMELFVQCRALLCDQIELIYTQRDCQEDARLQ